MSFQGNIIPRETIAENLANLIQDTLHTFKIAVKDFHLNLMSHIHPAIKQALDRKTTTVQLLLDKVSFEPRMMNHMMDGTWFPKSEVVEWLRDERVQIKVASEVKQNLFLFDNTIFMLVFTGMEGIEFSFVTKVYEITNRFRQMFDRIWKDGENINYHLLGEAIERPILV
jgi:sugar-specific transcriptional regulator TrmB